MHVYVQPELLKGGEPEYKVRRSTNADVSGANADVSMNTVIPTPAANPGVPEPPAPVRPLNQSGAPASFVNQSVRMAGNAHRRTESQHQRLSKYRSRIQNRGYDFGNPKNKEICQSHQVYTPGRRYVQQNDGSIVCMFPDDKLSGPQIHFAGFTPDWSESEVFRIWEEFGPVSGFCLNRFWDGCPEGSGQSL